MKKIIKKILFVFFIMSLNFISIKTFGQKEKLIIGGGFGMLNSHTVQINNMKYDDGTNIPSGASIKIPSGGNVNVKFDVTVKKNNGINNGFVKIYYKSTQNSTPVTIGSTMYHNNPQNTFWSVNYELNLTSGMFSQGFTGSLYAQFENNGGAGWKSTSFSVTIDTSGISNNTISSNQTIVKGENPSILVGSIPTGGNGNYSYQWQRKTTSNWSNILGGTSKSYSPNVLNITTFYRRIIFATGSPNSVSNTVKITVEDPPIINNIISFDYNTKKIIGSVPSGGSGNYAYKFYLVIDVADGLELIIDTGSNKDLDSSSPNFNSIVNNFPNFSVRVHRTIYSGSRIHHSSEIYIQSLSNKETFKNHQDNNSFIDNLIEISSPYPNPTTSILKFKVNFIKRTFIELILTNLKTKTKDIYVYKGEVKEGENVVTSYLPQTLKKGIYSYRIMARGRIVKKGKIIYN